MNPTDIRKQYFRSWFIVDLASSIPFDMLVSKVKNVIFYNLSTILSLQPWLAFQITLIGEKANDTLIQHNVIYLNHFLLMIEKCPAHFIFFYSEKLLTVTLVPFLKF